MCIVRSCSVSAIGASRATFERDIFLCGPLRPVRITPGAEVVNRAEPRPPTSSASKLQHLKPLAAAAPESPASRLPQPKKPKPEEWWAQPVAEVVEAAVVEARVPES